jgi:tetratricopeptide (TPR) repeat protein
LKRQLKLQPRDLDALFLLGQSLQAGGDTPGALEAWRQVLAINPEHTEALYNLARALNASAPAQAAEYRKQMVAVQQSRQVAERAESLGNFALGAASARDWPRAIAQMKEALEICGNCRARADLHKNLGLIYARSGDTANAEAALRLARQLKPADAEVVQALEVIRARRP